MDKADFGQLLKSVPTEYGDYQITGDKLGGGAFGDVFPAKKINSNLTNLVLKISKSNHNKSDDERIQQFFKEYDILKSLNHPNIVKCYDAFVTPSKQIILVFERATIGTLKDILSKKIKLTASQVKDIAMQLIQGLMFVHSKDIIHKDIKSENVLLFDNFQVKLADFGISKIVEQTYVNTQYAIQGSNQHMAPEQKIAHPRCSQKSDIFSLGILLYELCYQKYPFDYGYVCPSAEQAVSIDNLAKSFSQKIDLSKAEYNEHSINQMIEGMLEFTPEKRITLERASRAMDSLYLSDEAKSILEQEGIFQLFEKCDLISIKYMVEICKTNLQIKDSKGNTPFMAAVEKNPRVDAIKYLAEMCQCDLSSPNKHGNTPIMIAAQFNPNIEVIKYLVEVCKCDLGAKNDEGNTTVMILAQKTSRIDVIKYLIQDCHCNPNAQNEHGNTPLTLASQHNSDLQVIKFLVEVCKCDVNVRDNAGDTPYILAAYKNPNIEVLKYFVEFCKCNLNTKNNNGSTPLTLAAYSNSNIRVIKYLVEVCQLDYNSKNNAGDTPLIVAAYNNPSLEIIKYFVEVCKCDTNVRNHRGNTPLLVAAVNNSNVDIVKYFVETCKCDLYAKNNDGCTALELSQYNPIGIVKNYLDNIVRY